MKPILIIAILFSTPCILLGQTGGTITVAKPKNTTVTSLGKPKIAGRYNGSISTKDLLDSAIIRVDAGTVVSFKTTYTRSGILRQNRTNGSSLRQEDMFLIRSMKPYEKICFEDIRIVTPNGLQMYVPSMVFTIGKESDPILENDVIKLYKANIKGVSHNSLLPSNFCDKDHQIDVKSKNFFVSSFRMVLVTGEKEKMIKTKGDRVTSVMCKAIAKAPQGSMLHFDQIKLKNSKKGQAKAEPLTFKL